MPTKNVTPFDGSSTTRYPDGSYSYDSNGLETNAKIIIHHALQAGLFVRMTRPNDSIYIEIYDGCIVHLLFIRHKTESSWTRVDGTAHHLGISVTSIANLIESITA